MLISLFLSKVIEKAIAIQIHKHLSKTGIIDDFQSAYKACHSYEKAFLRVFNDIASTLGKGNGNLLVLLELSAAFDTIDHVILFAILKKYIGFDGNALKLLISYFSDRTQRVQIDGILSEFASLQGSPRVSFGALEVLLVYVATECYIEIS